MKVIETGKIIHSMLTKIFVHKKAWRFIHKKAWYDFIVPGT